MTVIFLDDFAGALNATNWLDEAAPPVWSTSGGEVTCSTANFRALKTTTSAHAAIADVQVKVKIASTAATFEGAVLARSNISGAISDTGNAYILHFFTSDDVRLLRRVNGVNNQIATRTQAFADGDTFALRVTGVGATVTLKIIHNDVQLGADVSDAAGSRIVAAGQTGLVVFGTGVFMDDFEVDDLIEPGTFIDAGIDTLAIAEQAAQVRLAKAIAAGVDAMVISELAASINLGASIGAGVDTLQIQEFQALLALQTRGYDIAKMFRYPSPLLRM